MIFTEELTPIKKTKSVLMQGNVNGVQLYVNEFGVTIPAKLVFQVKRGLESYVQKYYRRKKK